MRMHPTAAQSFSPRTALFFVKRWLSKNPVIYEFFHTPKGPVIFYKKGLIYMIKNPVNKIWFETDDLPINLAEMIALGFGWKKEKEKLK